jgi:hypothetical protein
MICLQLLNINFCYHNELKTRVKISKRKKKQKLLSNNIIAYNETIAKSNIALIEIPVFYGIHNGMLSILTSMKIKIHNSQHARMFNIIINSTII